MFYEENSGRIWAFAWPLFYSAIQDHVVLATFTCPQRRIPVLNMCAYLYWMFHDWLNPAFKNNPALPPYEEFLQELTETKWKFRSHAKIQIEAKEELKSRIKRSPEKADALAITFYPVPDFSIAAQKEKNKMLDWLAFNLG